MQHRLSIRLISMILLPVFVCFLFLMLLLLAFHVAYHVAIDAQEQDIRQLVDLEKSTVERLWISPRDTAIQALSLSPTLRQRLKGEIPFEELRKEWRAAKLSLNGCFFIYYGLQDGTVELYPDLELPEDFDARLRPWFQAGINAETGKTVWTDPYREIITRKLIVSTVTRINDDAGAAVGVFAADITMDDLQGILDQIQLPAGGSVFLLDRAGIPFVGTDKRYLGVDKLPAKNDTLFVENSEPLSNGWRIAVVIPRGSLAQEFDKLRRPILLASIILFVFSALSLTMLVTDLVARTRRLSGYFEKVITGDTALHVIFRTEDEFSFLNRQFNKVMQLARDAEKEKLGRERVFRFLLERVPIGFFRTRRDGEILYANTHFAELFGYTRKETGTLSIEALYENKEDRQSMLTDLTTNGIVRGRKILFVKKSGKPIWISLTALISPGEHPQGELEIEGFLVDATQDVQERESLLQLAETDALTKLANRRAFEGTFARLLENARAEGTPMSLILFDVDFFKSFNDSHGHDLGDEILRRVATVGAAVIRKGDLFARLGGDEFAILLPGICSGEAEKLALRIQQELSQVDPPRALDRFPSISIGITCRRGDDKDDMDMLFKRADTAMYRAKEAGRNRIELE